MELESTIELTVQRFNEPQAHPVDRRVQSDVSVKRLLGEQAKGFGCESHVGHVSLAKPFDDLFYHLKGQRGDLKMP
jgi:hypothetical protein